MASCSENACPRVSATDFFSIDRLTRYDAREIRDLIAFQEILAARPTRLLPDDGPGGCREAKLAQNQPSAAIPYLERAVQTYGQFPGSGSPGADAQFALARALWMRGRDRTRAHSLATTAFKTYRAELARTVEAWAAHHPPPGCVQ